MSPSSPRIGRCSARSLPEPCRQNNSSRSGNPPSAHEAEAWRRPQTLGVPSDMREAPHRRKSSPVHQQRGHATRPRFNSPSAQVDALESDHVGGVTSKHTPGARCEIRGVRPRSRPGTTPAGYFPDSAFSASATVIIKVIGSTGDSPNPYR